MFDLFRSRDKAVRILLGGLLLVVALSMLTYLVPSYNNGTDPSDVVVADIGGNQLTLQEVQRQIQSTMRGRQLPPDILPNFIPQMVDQMVSERALAYEAERQGFEVTDAQVADAIRQYVPTLFPEGKFIGKDMYAGFLAQQNLSINDFEADMKRQLLVTRMRNIALQGTVVTPKEIEDEYVKKNAKVKIEYVKLDPEKFKGEIKPANDEMMSYFKAHTADYTSKEKRNLSILIADQPALEQSVNPTDADVRRMYTQNPDSFRMPDRVKIRQILLKTQGKSPAEEAQVKTKAEDLLKQLKAGADFADLAKKNSEDPSSAANGGVMADWLTHGQFSSPDFEKVAFSLKPGQTSDLVKVDYGYHIIQVMQKEEARVKPFEEVKADLVAQYKKQKASDLMQQVSDKAQAMLQKDPGNPEKVAADLNMQLVKADGTEAGKAIPEIGASPDFDQAVSSLKKGEVSQPIALSATKLAIALVRDVIPPQPSTFEQVQSQVRDAIVSNRLVVLVQAKAKELQDKAASMGGDLAKAAKAMGLDAKTSEEFTRSGTIEGLGSASAFSDAFGRPDGQVFGPVSSGSATVVAKVIAHVQPDMSKLPEQRAAIRDDLKSQKARDRNALFDAGLRDALIKQGKIKYHQDVITRLIAGYRGNS